MHKQASRSIGAAVPDPKVRRLSAALHWACATVALLLPLAVLAFWLLAEPRDIAARTQLGPGAIRGPVEDWQWIASALASTVPAVFASMGLWQARRCFAGFARGELFTARAVDHLRGFAAWMGGSALAAFVVGPAVSVLLTWNNPPGMRQLAVGLSSDQFFTLLFAAVVWLMAGVIAQGQALADENASFV